MHAMPYIIPLFLLPLLLFFSFFTLFFSNRDLRLSSIIFDIMMSILRSFVTYFTGYRSGEDTSA